MSEIPIFMVNSEDADLAYEAYIALRKLSQDEPALADNKYFAALQETAFARFLLTFERVSK